MKLILKTKLFKTGSCCGIQFGVFCSMCGIDMIHIVHQIQSGLSSNMFIKSTAEIIGNVVFTVRKSAGASKSAHNSAGFTFDAGGYFFFRQLDSGVFPEDCLLQTRQFSGRDFLL